MFEDLLSQVVIAGVPLIVFTLGLVEAVKRFGVSGKPLLAVSLVAGTAFYAAHQLSQMYPIIAPWLNLVVYGIGGGLATSGIYDFVNKRLPVKPIPGDDTKQ